ncbi:hypothetical protein FO519_006128 [Halicephalobus sp. NKZ332]|nr:hypothetical protein FO519_006128 [Halicephalobus sp. NKZ332]
MYDSSAAKSLVESKKFDYIQAGPLIFGDFNDVHIDTKELKIRGISLEKILKTEFIKTNSLIIGYSNEHFKESLITMDVSPGFESLEKLELEVINRDTFLNPQKILEFLEFLNTKLTSLKCLTLDYNEHHQMFYENDQEGFNFSPESFNDMVKYEEKLNVYNGRIKVRLNHHMNFNVIASPREAVESHYEKLKKELRGFGYFVYIQDNTNIYNFRRSSSIVENLEDDGIRINIDLEYLHMKKLIRWILSSVREVEIDVKDPLPEEFINLLLGNKNFTRLKLVFYDLPSAKSLIESRKFDCIEMGYPISNNLNDIHIDTKELEFISVPLVDIFKAESIKTDSLITHYSDAELNDSLASIKVG